MTTMIHHHSGQRWWQVAFPILRPSPAVDITVVAAQARAARQRTELRASELQRAMAATLAEVDSRARNGLSG
jgi:hypothetical protein